MKKIPKFWVKSEYGTYICRPDIQLHYLKKHIKSYKINGPKKSFTTRFSRVAKECPFFRQAEKRKYALLYEKNKYGRNLSIKNGKRKPKTKRSFYFRILDAINKNKGGRLELSIRDFTDGTVKIPAHDWIKILEKLKIRYPQYHQEILNILKQKKQ